MAQIHLLCRRKKTRSSNTYSRALKCACGFMDKMTRNHRRRNRDSQDPRKLLKLPVIKRLKMRIVQKADISFRKIYA